MIIKRDFYLSKLIQHKKNGLVKIITGIRRCGKSYLFKLIIKELKKRGINEEDILLIDLSL